jgi:3-deoxy-manno-octulosonate cytidylyltransferase (CMP-KDO synthetase)
METETNEERSYIIIPARLASTRLPRKLLLRETGMTVLEHTYRAAKQSRLAAGICIAADHEEIAAEVRRFGGEVCMTSPACASGTDRVAEVAAGMSEVDIVVNVQGDEPEIDSAAIDQLITLLRSDPKAVAATLATPLRTAEKLAAPSCVKVVFDAHQRALYFSRSPIPHAREFKPELLTQEPAVYYQHLGLYAYRRNFLLELAKLPQTPLEKLESLEQLRILENGRTILVGIVEHSPVGIDTPEDYRAFVSRMKGSAN